MKALVRKILNKKQRHTLYVWRMRLLQWVVSFLEFVLNLLPCRLKIFLKSHIHVKKRMDYGHWPIWLDLSSSMEYTVRTRSCVKEPETVAWIEGFRPGEVLWDIGANVGAYSLVTAKFMQGKTAVYAIEPSFLNFAQLCRNIALNGCGSAITPLNIALSDQTNVGVFNYQNLEFGGALHTFGDAVDFKNECFDPVFRQNIMSFAIDDLIKIFRLPAPAHIKIDVDGIELKVLKGASAALAGPAVKSILVEIGEKDQAIMDFLSEKGFKVQARYSQGHEDLAMFNYIFVK